MSWYVQEKMLDPNQRRIVDLVVREGNYYVKGEAGTGKSMMLVHAAKTFRREHPGARVCVLTYTNALVACLRESGFDDDVPVMTIDKFVRDGKGNFDLILIDEVQDLDRRKVPLLKRLGKKFVLSGDFAQMIYDGIPNHESISEEELKAGFAIRETFELQTDYRLPRNHRTLVQSLFNTRTFAASVFNLLANVQIPLYHGKDWDDEMAYVIQKAKSYAVAGKLVAVLFEQKKRIFRFLYTVLNIKGSEKIDLDTVNDILKKRDLPFRFLGNGIGGFREGDSRPLIYVMTWHSSKGLDFDTVILPDLGRSPCRENLFYVALTRSRRNLVLTYSGTENERMAAIRKCPCVHAIATEPAEPPSLFGGGTQEPLF